MKHSIAHRIRITAKGIRCLDCPWGWKRTRVIAPEGGE